VVRYGQLDAPGFRPKPGSTFGDWMWNTVQDEASGLRTKIDSGQPLSARELWDDVAAKRSQLAIANNERDAAYFGFARTTAEHEIATPIRGERYGRYGERMPELGTPDPQTGGYSVQMQGRLPDGSAIPLTRLDYAPAFAAPDFQGFNPNWMIHTKPEQLPRVMDHVDDLLNKSAQLDPASREFRDTVAEMHWFLAQAAPSARGSAAQADAFVRSVMESRGIRVPAWQQGIVPDLEAIFSRQEDFIRRYGDMFDGALVPSRGGR
jgi:hypothetical protein